MILPPIYLENYEGYPHFYYTNLTYKDAPFTNAYCLTRCKVAVHSKTFRFSKGYFEIDESESQSKFEGWDYALQLCSAVYDADSTLTPLLEVLYGRNLFSKLNIEFVELLIFFTIPQLKSLFNIQFSTIRSQNWLWF
jgi:hypothetical protein